MNRQGPVHVIGAGGHAKVVVRCLQRLGYTVSALFDDNRALWGQTLLGAPICGPVADIVNRPPLPTVIALGDNRLRCQLAAQYTLEYLAVIDPCAVVDPSARIGHGSVVLPGAIVSVDATLGEHAIVNHGVTVDHDCRIGEFAQLAPGVHLAGEVKIGIGVLMGIGAVAIPRTEVGAWSVVGAGAAVVEPLPDRVIAVGVPARPVVEPGNVVVPPAEFPADTP
jgi:sugar O-acyltransferase (sialic acid O-acetyltransferase NeuD family)